MANNSNFSPVYTPQMIETLQFTYTIIKIINRLTFSLYSDRQTIHNVSIIWISCRPSLQNLLSLEIIENLDFCQYIQYSEP